MSAEEQFGSEKRHAFLQKLKQLETRSLVHYLIRVHGWTIEQAVSAILNYLLFLYLTHLYPHVLLVPTAEIDAVWHCHILHTQKYQEDCQFLFGYYLDHQPENESDNLSGVTDSNLNAAFICTQAAIKHSFDILLLKELWASLRIQLKLPQEQPVPSRQGRFSIADERAACGRPIVLEGRCFLQGVETER